MTRKVFIPVVPPKELNPNARVHYMTRSHWTKRYRDLTCLYCQEACEMNGWAPLERGKISFVFRYKTKRRRDYGNCLASAKALVDGFVDAGMVVDDDSEHLRIGSIGIETGVEEDGVLVILETDGVEAGAPGQGGKNGE